MPRVVHVISTPAGFGGAERVVQVLAAEGARRGWDHEVLNPFARFGPPLAPGFRPPYPAPYAERVTASLRDLPAARRWLLAELERACPDVVHAHLFHAAAAVASLPRRYGPRVLTHHHGSVFEWSARRLHALGDCAVLRRYDRVVAVSDSVLHHLRTRCRCPASALVKIGNAWSGQPLPPLPHDRPTVVCIANFRAEKGHEVLIDAFEAVVQRLPDALLVLAGSGPLEEPLRARVDGLGLTGNVRFTGIVDDVWPVLADSDVFVLPSLFEPLGISALEAMAAGLPVVASAVGGLTEVVEAGVSGTLVPPADRARLAGALVEILMEPPLREAMGRAARQAARRWTADVMVEGYLSLYEQLLEARKRSGPVE